MPARLADHWADLLPTHHREALADALDWLTDSFLDEYDEIASGRLAFSESLLGSNLPRMHAARYDRAFAKRFFACLLTVGWKLAQAEPPEPLLSCTAEELALRVLIDDAGETLRDRGIEDSFDAFESAVFDDADHIFLYVPAVDGIEDSEAGAELGVGHLRFEEWFAPFENATTAVHPYAAES